MNIVIIEDEALLAEALRDEILSIDPNIRVLKLLPSIKESLEYFEKNGFPDLIFSDIELSDGLSFEIFKRLSNIPPIIFCTAYNHYATEAFRVHSIDYILKPFEREDIENALGKYEEKKQEQISPSIDIHALLKEMQGEKEDKERNILVQKGTNIIPISTKEIALAEIKNGTVYIHTFGKKRYPINHNIEKTYQILGTGFYRVNRQFIINRKAVNQVAQYFARKLLIKPSIDFSEQIIVSKANATDFLRWLENS